MKLTPQERRIISEFELNVQRSTQEVANLLKVRLHTVQHVLRRLKEKNAIKPTPFIDVARLGKLNVGVYFSLALSDRKALATLLNNLQKSPSVAFLESLAGDFQFIAVLHCLNLNEVRTFLQELSKRSNGAVISKSVIPRTRYRQYRRKYLSTSKQQEGYLEALNNTDTVALTAEEQALFSQLARGQTDSIREAARELKLAYSTADYRYQQLLEKGVIKGWFYDIQDPYLDVQKFKLLISCRHLTADFTKGLEQLARLHPNVTHLLETLGEWDFEIGIECSHPSEVMAITALFHEKFPSQIASIKTLTELQTLKFTMSPS